MNKDKIQSGIRIAMNVASPIASAVSIVNPNFLLVPVIASVTNELFAYFDSKSTEKRLSLLEQALIKKGISVEEFQNLLEDLDENDQYVVRNNIKHLCISAVPKTVDSLIDTMIAFIRKEEQHETDEELLEILQSCNSVDIDVLTLIKGYMQYGCRDTYKKKYAEAVLAAKEQEKEANLVSDQATTGGIYRKHKWYDRSIIFGENTVFWDDFMKSVGVMSVSPELMLNSPLQKNGEEIYDWVYIARSLLKLQSLGVLQIDHKATIGTVCVNNIERFHITLFGERLLSHIGLQEDDAMTKTE